MQRGLSEGLRTTFASPVAAMVLGVLGFASAAVAAFADATAAALVSAAVLVLLTALLVHALRVESAFDGPFKVLDSLTEWDLRDPRGALAYVKKTQRVRFYYRTPVVSDTAWNDTASDPFSDYRADHGVKIGTANQGKDRHVIVQLHQPAERGDERTLVSIRKEHDQFPKMHDEWVELQQTQRGPSAMTVMFPRNSPPCNVRLYSSRDQRTIDKELPTEAHRKVFRLEKVDMKPDEKYILQWDWEPRIGARDMPDDEGNAALPSRT